MNLFWRILSLRSYLEKNKREIIESKVVTTTQICSGTISFYIDIVMMSAILYSP
jgi:hypothetical protein